MRGGGDHGKVFEAVGGAVRSMYEHAGVWSEVVSSDSNVVSMDVARNRASSIPRDPDMRQACLDSARILGPVLFDMVEVLFRRYVVFDPHFKKHQATTLALWTAHTHCFAAAETTPYIAVTAPTMEQAKLA